MNIARLLLLPWWATPRRAAWWIGGILALIALAGIIAFGTGRATPDHDGFGVLVSFNVVVAVALLPNLMVLARDARALRLPALEHETVMSLIVYAVLLIVVPGMLISVPGLSAVQTVLAVGLCAALALAYACLPAYFSIFLVFGWIAINSSSKQLFIATAAKHAFTLWASFGLSVLVIALVWSWRRTVHGALAASSMQAPMVLKFRISAWDSLRTSSSALEHQRMDWLRPQPDLRRCGPNDRVRSLRIALGGLFLPQRWQSRVRNWLWIVLWSSIFVVMLGFQAWERHPQHLWAALSRVILFGILVWGIGFGSTLVALVALLRLRRLWQSPSAELPLLALLPGLSQPQDLARAMLIPPLFAQGVLLALSLTCALALHLHLEALAFTVITQAGAIGFFVAFALSIAAGRLPARWVVYAMTIVALVLANMSLFIPALSDASAIQVFANSLANWLIGGWVVLGIALAWLARRGWVCLHERPHPFLPSSA